MSYHLTCQSESRLLDLFGKLVLSGRIRKSSKYTAVLSGSSQKYSPKNRVFIHVNYIPYYYFLENLQK